MAEDTGLNATPLKLGVPNNDSIADCVSLLNGNLIKYTALNHKISFRNICKEMNEIEDKIFNQNTSCHEWASLGWWGKTEVPKILFTKQ